MTTKIRSSKQLHIDANLNLNNQKIVSLNPGSAGTDGVNVDQLNTAIGDATSGLGNSIHVPVADLAAAKAIISTERADKMIMNIESLGLYRYDLESVAVSNNDTVIRPTDIASDATPGRWIKMSSTINDHNNLSNIQGGTVGQYNHLTNAQLTALHAAETASSIGVIVNGAAAATPNDTDLVATVESSVVKKITWANVKTFLTGVFWPKTATGDVTINVSTNVTAIGALKVVTGMIQANAVTNIKLAQVATQTFKGRTTALTGDVEDLTIAQARTLLGLTSLNLAQRKYRVTPTGVINGSNLIFTIADNVISGTEEVFKNGVLQTATVNYTISYGATTTITFVLDYVPSNVGYNDILSVNYSI